MYTFSTNLFPLIHINSKKLESTWREGTFGWFAPGIFIFGKYLEATLLGFLLKTLDCHRQGPFPLLSSILS